MKETNNDSFAVCNLLLCLPNVHVYYGPPCRCEHKTGEDVCGANGVTYMSMCHAVNCAHLQQSDVAIGSCASSKDQKVLLIQPFTPYAVMLSSVVY